MDSRNEVIMFKVGDLVRYDTTIWNHSLSNSPIGLIVDLHPIFTKIVIIQWNDGVVEEVNAGHLEVICLK